LFEDEYLTDVDWTFGVNTLLRRRNKFDGLSREIGLNDPAGNKVKGWESNSVRTGKFGPITFMPKFLFGEKQIVFSTDE
jgi:phospholipid-transporting ATPase